ncbi:MAG: hypothetical protein KAS30_01340 [Candidatus Diapherotrites archaeon]|nr:hypothetical protein [Candidatus Diapherotrites archaeon]
MALSTAIDIDVVSRIVGYQLTKGDFSTVSPNLPQRIALLGEANTANQGAGITDPLENPTLQEVGVKYGYGSPIYNMYRILKPLQGGGVGSVPVKIYAQDAAGGSTASVLRITPTGTATGNATHTVVINGRRSVDGGRYDFAVVTGDTATTITAKIIDTINGVLAAPVVASDATNKIDCTAKWTGLTSEGMNIEVDTNDASVGMSYAVASTASGAGTPSVTASLNMFNNEWNTFVVNPYTLAATFVELENYNGIPDQTNPTGRYRGEIFKPFIAVYGDLTEDPSTLTDATARKSQVTNACAPAPNSLGLEMEAAANMVVEAATVANNTPHLDVNAHFYSDMPVPSDGDIGPMSTHSERDSLVKKGSSTVDLVSGRYQIQDLVTTYHPDGEVPPAYRYVRNLNNVDYNIRYSYFLLEQIHVVDHAIASDDDVVSASNVIKPKQWKALVDDLATQLGRRALISDVPFMQASIVTELNATNPDRLDTTFSYKRSGTVRIASTTVTAGFNFGQA